jgi:hypothetical protein
MFFPQSQAIDHSTLGTLAQIKKIKMPKFSKK